MIRSKLPAQAGLSLLEVMVALAILLVGLLGMMGFQIFGLNANAAARKHTEATQLAEELVSGLERLPFADPLISETGGTGPTAPKPFGRLLDPSTGRAATGAHEWTSDTGVPGVRLPGAGEWRAAGLAGGDEGGQFERRWTVWGYSPSAGAPAAVKIIAVSIIYREPKSRMPREVVLYTQHHDPAALASNIAANQ